MPTPRATGQPVDFVTDVPYTSEYYEHLSPGVINYAAALGGYRPRPAKRLFTYCELGCGNGVTTVVLAASNPGARFVGIDANAAHIEAARALADRCGVLNAAFHACTIGDALRMDLPTFDFIGAHGLWSWVGDEARADIVAFIDRTLKPGALLSLSYNALPGCAEMIPLREMMLAYSDHKGGGTLERLANGLAYVRFMAENRSGFFERRPELATRLDELMRSDVRYLAHEYFTPNWKPEYFAAVAKRLSPHGLCYAGSYPLEMNYTDLCIPERFRPFFQGSPNREVFETHRDFVQDTRFRIDIYARSRATKGGDAWSSGLFDGVVFAPIVPPDQFGSTARVAGLELELQGAVIEPLRAALDGGPASFVDLVAAPGLSGLPPAQVARALQYLVLARHVLPALRKPLRIGQGLSPANRVLLQRAVASGLDVAVLASTAVGGGVSVRSVDAMAFSAARESGAQGRDAWYERFCREAGAEPVEATRFAALCDGMSPLRADVLARLGI